MLSSMEEEDLGMGSNNSSTTITPTSSMDEDDTQGNIGDGANGGNGAIASHSYAPPSANVG